MGVPRDPVLHCANSTRGVGETFYSVQSSLSESPLLCKRIIGSHISCGDRLNEVSMATSPTVASNPLETRTIRKATMRIIPLIFALFIIAALDRNNIGFAALTMNKELAIRSQQYGFIAGIFFF